MSRARSDEAGDVEAAADLVRERARPLDRDALDSLVEAAGDAQYVLLGEASHGTGEFYRWRTRLTARLVREHGASFVAVEGDWTDCLEIDEYVRGQAEGDAVDVLSAFDRWPTWTWANWEVAEFVEWLREHDEAGDAVGFYGMDVYGLFESMAAVIDYLEEVDPEAAARARDAYHCFEPYGEDAREYGRSTRLVPDDCEDEVVDVLTEVGECAPDGTASRPSRPSRTRSSRATPRSTTGRWRGPTGSPGTSATATWPRRSSGWSTATAAPR